MMSLVPTLAACRSQDNPIGLVLVFESATKDTHYVDRFTWPNMRSERGIFGGGGLYLSQKSPAEMAFMAEEIGGLPEWFDISWQWPLVDGKKDDYESQFVQAKRYSQRIAIRSQVPQSVVDSLRPGRVLKLRFTFIESTVKFDHFVEQWK